MVNAGSTVAHLVKLLVTAICMRHFSEPYRGAKVLPATHYWYLNAIRMLFIHSVLGILRFAVPFTSTSTATAKCFRSFYDWYSYGIEIFPLALLTSGILGGYQIDETIRMLFLFFGIIPIFFPLLRTQTKNQARKYYLLIDIIVVLQILAIMILGLRNGNYNVISLVVSYTFEHFFVRKCCHRYSIPQTDLEQYCICFNVMFTISTLKDL